MDIVDIKASIRNGLLEVFVTAEGFIKLRDTQSQEWVIIGNTNNALRQRQENQEVCSLCFSQLPKHAKRCPGCMAKIKKDIND